MDLLNLFYFLLGALLLWGARRAPKGGWNGEYTSRDQTDALRGASAMGVMLHHMAQKTCAPWNPSAFIVHGLDFFVDHQNVWWIRGEWWYNSVILFPLGLLYAKHEEKLTAALFRLLREGVMKLFPDRRGKGGGEGKPPNGEKGAGPEKPILPIC